MTKRVLIIPDIVDPPWAWCRRALGIQSHAPQGYEVDIVVEKKYKRGMHKDYDAMLSMGWMSAPTEGDNTWTHVTNAGVMYDWNKDADFYPQRCASRAKCRKKAIARLPQFKGVITIDHRTVQFLKKIHQNVVFLDTAVDCDVFYPRDQKRQNKLLRVGWIGKAYDDPKMWTSKGYSEVLLPLVEKMKRVVLFDIQKGDYTNALKTADLLTWYRNLDLLLVTSCSDSTPSTLLEACACGVPFVSTNVGVAADLNRVCPSRILPGAIVGKWERRSEISEVVRRFEYVLRSYIREPDALVQMGHSSRETVERFFSWEHSAKKWLEVMCSVESERTAASEPRQ